MTSHKTLVSLAVPFLSLALFCCSGSDTGPGSVPPPTGTGATIMTPTGAQGGTVTLEGTTLTIPAGALSSSEPITVTSTKDSPPAGVRNLSPIYQFGPAGLTFAVPVTV
ncbi:MAG: hypothetical protein ACRDGS_13995, partial [Chloroflexota bacterium]